MHRPPPISEAPKLPVTALLCAAAAAVSLISHSKPEIIDSLAMTEQAFPGQPWRLVTTILPHGSLPHIFFNLYWVWTLGTALESAFGHARYLAFVILSAAFATACEWALFGSGIGLSGVVYAMFGVLWALKRTRGYVGLIDKATITMFIAWFFLCIITTYFNLMNVANAAHAGGLAFGLLVGMCIRTQGSRRAAWMAATLLICIAVALGATTLRPTINLERSTPKSAAGYVEQAAAAMSEGRIEDAIAHLDRAAQQHGTNADLWKLLGSLYLDTGDIDAAHAAWARALKLNPNDTELSQLLQALRTAPDPEPQPEQPQFPPPIE